MSNEPGSGASESPEIESSFTSQVLLLYYLLLYQDTVYNNMKVIGKCYMCKFTQ